MIPPPEENRREDFLSEHNFHSPVLTLMVEGLARCSRDEFFFFLTDPQGRRVGSLFVRSVFSYPNLGRMAYVERVFFLSPNYITTRITATDALSRRTGPFRTVGQNALLF